jgi:hypothetical protein
MTLINPPPDFVIRLGHVVIDRDALANALEAKLDRYELSRDGSSTYAQISLDRDANDWQEIGQFLDKVGPRIKGLIDQGAAGSACIDFAVAPGEGTYAKFVTVPASVAKKAGRHSIDIEVSVYPFGQKDGDAPS